MPISRAYRLPAAIFVFLVAVWTATGLAPPAGRLDWFLENVPAMLAGEIMLASAGRFRLSNWVYGCCAVHACILAYGGYYTYAQTPLGDWLRDALHLSRNPYDRLGHLAQGFFPSFVLREPYLRRTCLVPSFGVGFAVLSGVLALSASYELLEGITAHFVSAGGGNAFLGTQGDIWDTQWDMFCALCGGLLAQTAPLRGCHDRSLRAVEP